MVTPLRVTVVAHFNRSVEVCEKKKVEKARREETQNSYTIKKKTLVEKRCRPLSLFLQQSYKDEDLEKVSLQQDLDLDNKHREKQDTQPKVMVCPFCCIDAFS